MSLVFLVDMEMKGSFPFMFFSIEGQLIAARCRSFCGIPDQVVLAILFRPDGKEDFLHIFKELELDLK